MSFKKIKLIEAVNKMGFSYPAKGIQGKLGFVENNKFNFNLQEFRFKRYICDMKRIFFLLLIAPLFLLNSCKKEAKNPDYGELPVLEETKWIKRMKDDFDRMTTQTLSFGYAGKGWFQTTDYVMYDGYTIKGFMEETAWTLKGDVIEVHFSREGSMYFPERMHGTYKWDEDGNPILSFGGEVYRKL